MFRKRRSGEGSGRDQVDHLLAQDTPLDEGEQERIIQDFEEMQLQNSRMWRRTFGAGEPGMHHRSSTELQASRQP